jgi:hypothetical protein
MSKKQTQKAGAKVAKAKVAAKRSSSAKTTGATAKQRTAAGREPSAVMAPTVPGPEGAPRLPAPGTVIQKRDRYGQVRCECTVEEGGIRYRANLYRSLSAAAMAAAKDLELTNKTQNGWTFWGLTKPPRPSKDSVEILLRGWERFRATLMPIVKAGVTDDNRAKVLAALHKQSETLREWHDQVA